MEYEDENGESIEVNTDVYSPFSMEQPKEKRYFVYVRKGTGTRKDPHCIQAYEILAKSLDYIGYEEFSPCSYKGDESIAFSILHAKGIVSGEEYEKVNGYYYQHKGQNIDIRGI